MKALLCAATAAALVMSGTAAAQTAPAVKSVPAFKAQMAGLVLMPTGVSEDAAREYRDKEVVYAAPLALERAGALTQAATFDMYGKSVTIAADTPLTSATAKGGDLDAHGTKREVLCADSDTNFAKGLAAASTLLLSTLFSRFMPTTQICLVDTNMDQTMDHAFMLGTRMSEDRHLIPITPVAYTTRNNAPLRSSAMVVRFVDKGLLSKPRMETAVVLNGQALAVDHLRLGADRKKAKADFKIGGGAVPAQWEVAGARFSVDSISADGKVATIRRTADVTQMPFDFVQQTSYTVIYY